MNQRLQGISRDISESLRVISYAIEQRDIDNVYSHVSHGRSVGFLEKARLEFLEERGFGEMWWRERHILLVVVAIQASYHRELKQSPLFATIDNVWFEENEIVVTQRLFTHNKKLAVSATVHSACLHAEKKRAVEPPSFFVEAMKKLTVGRCTI
jgi:YbgC/YbaW family acyl-CoA thioester hydrolase